MPLVTLYDIFRICHIESLLSLKDVYMISQTCMEFLLLLDDEIKERKSYIMNTCNFTDILRHGVLEGSCKSLNPYSTFKAQYTPNNVSDNVNDCIHREIQMVNPSIFTIVSCSYPEDISYAFSKIGHKSMFDLFNYDGDSWMKITFNHKGDIVFLCGEECYYGGMSGNKIRNLFVDERWWRMYTNPDLHSRLRLICSMTRSMKYSTTNISHL